MLEPVFGRLLRLLLVSRLLVLLFDCFCAVKHPIALRMIDKQPVLVLLCSQLGEGLVLQDGPLYDLHYFVLVEDSRA